MQDKTKQYLIIFSIDTVERPANAKEIAELLNDIPQLVKADGMYKGASERSYVADWDDMDKVLEYAKRYEQESVLFITKNNVSLYYLKDNNEVSIGSNFIAVPEAMAKAQEAYTKLNGLYYVVVE